MFNFNTIINNRPIIMGIVNVTPDSFSDGGAHFDGEKAVEYALELISDGADIIDLGAQSTRPGYTEIPPEEEISRLSGVLPVLRKKTDKPISVDTYFPAVAQWAVENGADIINDVSGVFNTDMAQIVKNSGAGWVIMHNGDGSESEVKAFFEDMVQRCADFGINKAQICLDMGIGFGKTYEQNLELIANVSAYKLPDYPLLLGTSRKRVIGAASQTQNPTERIYGNIAADTAAILGGADIIRIHDVKNEIKGILTAKELKKWTKSQ
ncbi:MAG: dihydropteroate synthase [Eubacterium sp.]|nr:dihydropteroate synthase [Eubacterium sp.]